MTLPAFLRLRVGGTQVPGSSRAKDREGQIMVFGLQHEVTTDRGPDGHPAGPPRHRSFVIVKDIDRASAHLQRAFEGNVAFSEFLLELQRMPPVGGPQESYVMIGLTNPRITSIRAIMPNLRNPEYAPLPEREEVAFSYEQISWKYWGKGDGSESGDADYTEREASFEGDGPSSVAKLEAKLQAKATALATSAGLAAKEWLKKFLEQELATPGEGGGGGGG
jgi:type VI secretion system secreted protein Hcp